MRTSKKSGTKTNEDLAMPKRKRDAENDPVKLRKEEVEQKLVHCKKLLNKALKLAKGFERQKLSRRVKQATEKSEIDVLKRLNKEIEVLKTLDRARAVDGPLYKSLLKSKRIAESPLLPERVHETPPKPLGEEEYVQTYNNVTSRLYKTKAVTDVMSQIMTIMYIALEIPEQSAPGSMKRVKVDGEGAGKWGTNANASMKFGKIQQEESDGNDSTVDSNDDGDDEEEEKKEEEENGDDFSVDKERLSRYESRLRNSSDSDSDSDSEPPISRESSFPPMPLPKKGKEASKSKAHLPMPKGSVFLPTLMGGYYSGSDSNASDIEDIDGPRGPAPQRKNRRGQRERRQIAEMKFGADAKHLVAGKSNSRAGRERDWDMKGGARLSTEDGGSKNRKQRGMAGMKGAPSNGRDNRKVTGENAIALGEGRGRKFDAAADSNVRKGKEKDTSKTGVNHPSWQAAKKAKEATRTASFQGTKIKF